MLSSKERAALRAMANGIETIGQVGKDGVGGAVIRQVSEALDARQLIKLRVLENAPLSARAAAHEIAEHTGADVVQVIGTRFVLYKSNGKSPLLVK